MRYNVANDLMHDVRRTANFHNGIALILEGDNDCDEGFKFLAKLFENLDVFDVGALQYSAVAEAAGLYDMDLDWPVVAGRALALTKLLRRIGKSGIEDEEIDRLFPEPPPDSKPIPEGLEVAS